MTHLKSAGYQPALFYVPYLRAVGATKRLRSSGEIGDGLVHLFPDTPLEIRNGPLKDLDEPLHSSPVTRQRQPHVFDAFVRHAKKKSLHDDVRKSHDKDRLVFERRPLYAEKRHDTVRSSRQHLDRSC